MSKISIVVPHYKETWDIVRPLFESIDSQLGFDLNEVEVIVVNDSPEDRLTGDLFQYYQFETRIVNKGHHGVSASRNFGLEEATGDYVMFCDCDDRFISAYALYSFAKHFGYSIIRTPFLEDQIIDGELKLIRHDGDVTFVHGKMYRRGFLIDNDIKFDPKLTIHEDGYFNILAHTIAGEDIFEIQPAVYLWKYNEDSVVRKNADLFLYKTYPNLMDGRIAICKQMKKRELFEVYFQSVAKTVIDSYYDFQKPEALDPNNKEIIESAEKEFARFYKEFREDYNEIGINDIANLMMVCRTLAFRNGMRVEQESLKDFVTRIAKKYCGA